MSNQSKQDKLLKLNFNINSIGFYYWIVAMNILENTKLTDTIKMSDIYKKIAIRFNTTPTRVERAMRHAREPATKRIESVYDFHSKQNNTNVLRLLVIF